MYKGNKKEMWLQSPRHGKDWYNLATISFTTTLQSAFFVCRYHIAQILVKVLCVAAKSYCDKTSYSVHYDCRLEPSPQFGFAVCGP